MWIRNAGGGGAEGLGGEEGVGSGGLAHRNRFLEGELDAASSGRSDGLLGGVIEKVVLQAATRSEGGGARALRGKRAAHPRPTGVRVNTVDATDKSVGGVGARMRLVCCALASARALGKEGACFLFLARVGSGVLAFRHGQ